jgi:hypothetical protein
MSQVYAHAQRQGLIPADMNSNPFRPPRLGGARCKSVSDYEAKVVNPQQMVAILAPATPSGWLYDPETPSA